MVQHPCGPLIIFILLHSNISSEVCHPLPVWFRFCVWAVWAAHLFMFPLSSQSHVHISIKLNPKFPFLFNSHHKFIPIVWSTPIWPRRLCLSSFSRAKVWVPNLGLLVLEPMWCGTCKILSGQIQRPSLYTYWGLLFYSDMYHTPSDKMNQPLAVHFLTDPNCVTPAWNHTFDIVSLRNTNSSILDSAVWPMLSLVIILSVQLISLSDILFVCTSILCSAISYKPLKQVLWAWAMVCAIDDLSLPTPQSCRRIVGTITITSSGSQVHIHLDFQSRLVIICIITVLLLLSLLADFTVTIIIVGVLIVFVGISTITVLSLLPIALLYIYVYVFVCVFLYS